MSLIRKLPVILFAIAIPLTSLHAQEPGLQSTRSAIPPKAKVIAQPAAMATPAPRRSIVERLFGIRPTPTPQPAPKWEDVAKPRVRPKRRPTPAPEPAVVRKAKPAAKETPAAEADAAVKPDDGAPAVESAAVKPGKGSKKPELAGLDDAAKFKAVKSTALEDAEIKALKTKADTTVDEAEAHRASIEYNKALFRKIRSIEPSLGDYVEGVEQAMMKRLGAEKSAQ